MNVNYATFDVSTDIYNVLYGVANGAVGVFPTTSMF